MFTSLVVNNVEGAYQAVRGLIEKGHRHIGFINGQIVGNFKFNPATALPAEAPNGYFRRLGYAGRWRAGSGKPTLKTPAAISQEISYSHLVHHLYW